MRLFLALAAVLVFGPAIQTAAHEFWLEPEAYRVPQGEPVLARAFNGENFFGVEYSYSERGFERSGIIAGEAKAPITGVAGQKPAISVQAAGPGLNIVYHGSALNSLTYATLTKFESFLKGKHLEAGLALHREQGLPEEDIKEVYFRYVKALVAVGDGAGSDRAVGMPYELVALTNPYTTSGPMRFQVLLSGSPVGANVPAFAFHKVGTSVDKIDLRTNASGEISVPRKSGAYMVNAVHLTPPTAKIKEATKAHWVTLWASSTYEIR